VGWATNFAELALARSPVNRRQFRRAPRATPHQYSLYQRYLVELPGIEPAPKIVVSCGNVKFDYAKDVK
jgi:hypothetical protein